jgi:anti-sigma-K factor RskA
MTGRDHTMIEELLSVDALAGLDDVDRALLDRERAAHGACEECGSLTAEFVEIAGRLGLSLDPVSVRAGMVDEILRTAGADADSDTPGGVSDRLAAAPDELIQPRERRSGGAWRGIVAVAAAFVLFAAGWVVRDATSSGGGELGASTFVRFTGDAGTLAMAYEPGKPGVLVIGSDLPDPGADHVYEIWMIDGEEAPVSGGCVRPEDGRIFTYIDANVGTADTMAVTVEPDSCPNAPTTEPVLTASLA